MFMKSPKPAAPKPVIDWSFCDYYVPEPVQPVPARPAGLFGRWRKRRT